jgi:hypothetical protein
MVDNRRGGFANPEGNGRFIQQSSNNSLYDAEQAKIKEELLKIDAELEESKLERGEVAQKVTNNLDKEYSEPHAHHEG